MKNKKFSQMFLLTFIVVALMLNFSHISSSRADEEDTVEVTSVDESGENETTEELKACIAQLHFESGDGKYTNITDNASEDSETPGSCYVQINGGTFTVKLKADALRTPEENEAEEKSKISGVKVLCVDISGVKQLLNDYNFKYEVSDVVVACDGNPVELDAQKLVLGSAEENDNLRIEIFNENGATAGENAPIDSASFEFEKELECTFTLKLVSKGQNAYIVFANGKGRYFSSPEKPKSEPMVVNGNGTYTLSLAAIDSEGDKVKVSGISNFYVVIPGLVNQISDWSNLRITDVSINCDGEPAEVDISEIYWGNTKNNGDFRIDFYDQEKSGADYSGALDKNKFSFRDKLEVTFTIEGLEVGFPDEIVASYLYIEPVPEEPEELEPEITKEPEITEAPVVTEVPAEVTPTEALTPTPSPAPTSTPVPIRGLNDNKVDKDSDGIGVLGKIGIVLAVIIVIGGGAAAIKFGKED